MRQSGVGRYMCRVANSIGNDTFNWNISFVQDLTPPELIVTPVDHDVNYGDTVLMVCVASGYPEPEVSWSHNGQLVDNASSPFVNIYNQVIVGNDSLTFTESIIEICGFELDDIGTFVCTATNVEGSVNSTAVTIDIFPSESILLYYQIIPERVAAVKLHLLIINVHSYYLKFRPLVYCEN